MMQLRRIGGAEMQTIALWARVVAAGLSAMELWSERAMIAELTQACGGAKLIAPTDLSPEATVAAVLMVGSPGAMSELPPTGDEAALALEALSDRLCRPIDAVVPLNLAGINAYWPILAAAQLKCPIVDSEGMGRVLPMVEQTVYTLGGLAPFPMALVGPSQEVVHLDGPDVRATEDVMRAACRAVGGWMMCACFPMTAAQLNATGLTGAISRAYRLGTLLEGATTASAREQIMVAQAGARELGYGRVVELEHHPRQVTTRWDQHPCSLIVDLWDSAAGFMRVEMGDTPLAVFVDGTVVAAIPDVILGVSQSTYQVWELRELQPGDVVRMMVLPADARWHTPAGYALAGPRRFGLPIDHPQAAKG